MKLALAGNYRVGSKMEQQSFAIEWQYGMRAGQGIPFKSPVNGEPVLNRQNPAFEAGLEWGKANRDCRNVKLAEAALNSAWLSHRDSI